MNTAYIRKLERLYRRVRTPLVKFVFPMMLLIWPLIKFNQGVDVSDSTYSLGNYLFPEGVQDMWLISTYLSNALGYVLVRLPFGDTLIGINIYTGLIVSGTALMCYYGLKKDFTPPVVFMGEMLAINFCWIPGGILYNYLSYFVLTLGALLLYRGITREDDRFLAAAGVVLGLNVFVRIPNLTQMSLILVLWYSVYFVKVHGRKKGMEDNESSSVLRRTIYCILGYAIGAGIPLCIISAVKGTDSLFNMVTGLSGISGTDDSYSVFSMLTDTLHAYFRSVKYAGIMLAVVFCGTLMLAVYRKSEVLKWFKRLIYIGVLALMLRFLWGRGMFTFRYYEDYTSMFEWGMLVLFMAWIAGIVVVAGGRYNLLVSALAAINLVILFITPLGSNNYTCQNLNNLFIVMPFTLYVVGGWMYRGTHRFRLEGVLYGCNFPWMSMVLMIAVMVVIQSTGFHMNFVFRDGMDGTPRDTLYRNVYTTEANATALTGLEEAVKNSGADEAIYWGNCPGLSYLFRLKPAISSSWPDLDSYPVDSFREELLKIKENDMDKLLLICRKGAPTAINGAEKEALLMDFVEVYRLDVAYENEAYIVYSRKKLEK
ncbi:MAG: hypothetical protein K5662_02540 [Lachnospiraceae bacterium]|nr:hypothetical protein [Lachnospiraceae bacterium]